MKLLWDSLKISIAGAKLSHLVQKDGIWDYGSMVEQVKAIFFKVKRIKNNGNVEGLEKYLSERCFGKIEEELDELEKNGKAWIIRNLLIKEVSIIEISVAKNENPDCFTALIKAIGVEFIADKKNVAELINYSDKIKNFSEQWSFVRRGEWWVLDNIKSKRIFKVE